MEYQKMFQTITELQTKESALYKSLDSTAAAGGDYQSMIDHINDLASARTTLIAELSRALGDVDNRVGDGRNKLEAQLSLAKVAEHELNQAKSRLNELDDTKNNKLRMVEINNYLGKRYQAYANIMKLIIYFCVPLLGLFLLKSYNLLSADVHTFLTGTLLAVGIFLIVRRSWDIFVRSDINFDEYNWSSTADPAVLHPTIWEYNKTHFLNIDTGLKKVINSLGIDCFGAACCAPGTRYDTNKHQCMLNEGFTRLPTIFEEKDDVEDHAEGQVAAESAAEDEGNLKIKPYNGDI